MHTLSMDAFTLRKALRFVLVTQALLCSLLSGGCEPSDTIQVTSTADGKRGSLRDAIKRANRARSAVTVQIPPGMYELTRCGADDDNRNGDLDVETLHSVTLAGTGEGVVIRQTCAGERVLDALEGGLLVLRRVTVTGGSVVSRDADVPALGGGVRAEGSVHLDHATVLENSATGAPGVGATANASAVDGGAAHGGGLYVRGGLFATDSVLSKNSALGGTGAPPSTLDGEAAGGGAAEGGGAYVFGEVVINGGAASDNRAIGGSGGSAERAPGGGGLARGGAIAQRTPSAEEAGEADAVTLIGSTLSDNTAQGGGYGEVLVGLGAPIEPLPPGGDGEGGAVAAAGPLTAKEVTAVRNTAVSGTSETRCVVFGRIVYCVPGAARGGALATAAVASIHAGRFEENRAASGNTTFYCIGSVPSCGGAAAAAALGGAVWSHLDLAVYDAAFSRNTVQQGTGLADVDGLAQGGAAASDGDVTVEGGSYAGNASMRGRGGALSGSEVSVQGATFTGNKAEGRGGAILARVRLAAEGVTASENSAGGGGGGAIAVTGDARIAGSSIRQNAVDSRQGLGFTVFAGGGGIAVTGHLTISETEVIGNTGRAGLYAGSFCNGCPLTFAGGGINAGSVEGNRVTIAGNTALGHTGLPGAPGPFGSRISGGGGIAAAGAVALINATLSANAVSAPLTPFDQYSGPAQGAAVLAPNLELEHATVADNANAASLQVTQLTTHRSVAIAPPGQTVCGVGGVIAGSSYNAFSDVSCGLGAPTDRQGEAAFLLGPLLDNGGPVPTRLPAASSVLLDRIPGGSCPVPVDARLVTRPQGPACDIGSVELAPVPGTGPTNLTLAFTNPPVVAVPGEVAVWELTLVNAGSAASSPAVQVEVPAGVTVISATATNGGACSAAAPVVCVWNTPVAPGTAAIITVTAQVTTAVISDLVWHAEVAAPELQPPLEDDRAELTTPLAPQTGVTVDVSSSVEFGGALRVGVFLRNAGPANVIGTADQPIRIRTTTEASSRSRLECRDRGRPYVH